MADLEVLLCTEDTMIDPGTLVMVLLGCAGSIDTEPGATMAGGCRKVLGGSCCIVGEELAVGFLISECVEEGTTVTRHLLLTRGLRL